MHEQFKDKKLDDLNQNLAGINTKMGSYWLAIGRGILSGFGYVLGAGIAIILIGWFLNVIGVIPALNNTAEEWREAFRSTSEATQTILPTDTTTPAE